MLGVEGLVVARNCVMRDNLVSPALDFALHFEALKTSSLCFHLSDKFMLLRQIRLELFEELRKACRLPPVVGAVTQFEEKYIPERIDDGRDKVLVSAQNGGALLPVLLEPSQCGGVIPRPCKVLSYGLRCAEEIFFLVWIHDVSP